MTWQEEMLLDRYGITPADLVRGGLHCEPEAIQPDVVLLPNWRAEIFEAYVDSLQTIVPNTVYEVRVGEKRVTLIRAGIGAPQTGDTVLALGATACRRLVFAGSAGSLRLKVGIGDLVVPACSLSGDGFTRYLDPTLPPEDTFFQPAYPNSELTAALLAISQERGQRAEVKVHSGLVFSTDSIVGQLPFAEEAEQEYDCIAIEMETAATFAAARRVGIAAAAILAISDSLPEKKTILNRDPEATNRYRQVRASVLAPIVIDLLAKG